VGRKNAATLFVVLMLAIALFELVFFLGFPGGSRTDEMRIGQSKSNIIFIIVCLSFIPCFTIVSTSYNAMLGFIPPLFLNGLYWFLIFNDFNRSGVDIFAMDRSIKLIAAGQVLIAGVFGVIFILLARSMIKKKVNVSDVNNKGNSADGDNKNGEGWENTTGQVR